MKKPAARLRPVLSTENETEPLFRILASASMDEPTDDQLWRLTLDLQLGSKVAMTFVHPEGLFAEPVTAWLRDRREEKLASLIRDFLDLVAEIDPALRVQMGTLLAHPRSDETRRAMDEITCALREVSDAGGNANLACLYVLAVQIEYCTRPDHVRADGSEHVMPETKKQIA